MSWPSLSNWGLIILMAISSGLIGHAMMNWSLVRIPLWVGSTFTLRLPSYQSSTPFDRDSHELSVEVLAIPTGEVPS